MDNPFSQAFSQLDRVVSEKQNRETRAIKGMITNFRSIEADFQGDKEFLNAVGLLRNKLMERCAQDAAQARAAVKPVTHTIQITPK